MKRNQQCSNEASIKFQFLVLYFEFNVHILCVAGCRMLGSQNPRSAWLSSRGLHGLWYFFRLFSRSFHPLAYSGLRLYRRSPPHLHRDPLRARISGLAGRSRKDLWRRKGFQLVERYRAANHQVTLQPKCPNSFFTLA